MWAVTPQVEELFYTLLDLAHIYRYTVPYQLHIMYEQVACVRMICLPNCYSFNFPDHHT